MKILILTMIIIFFNKHCLAEDLFQTSFHNIEFISKNIDDDILEFYINRIFFGSGIYGIEKASLSYFGKKAKDMSLSEGAMLAGIIRGPNRFSPFRNIEGANKERKTVLRRMLDEGIITIDDYQNSMNNEVRVLKQKKSYKEQIAYNS